MAFKLGRYKTLPGIATNGKLNKKFNFKIEHKDLEEGVTAEAVSKDKMVIDKDVPKGSDLYKRAVAHEAVHCKEMAEGRIAYGDDWVRADGKIKYNGEWHEEGSKVFPWEQRAMKAEKYV